jgi:hypothetical protein
MRLSIALFMALVCVPALAAEPAPAPAASESKLIDPAFAEVLSEQRNAALNEVVKLQVELQRARMRIGDLEKEVQAYKEKEKLKAK